VQHAAFKAKCIHAVAGLGCLRPFVNPAGCNLDYVPFVFLTQSSQPLRHIKAKLAGSKIGPMNPVHPSVVASWREERSIPYALVAG
jgi:hypothetical protein